MAQRRLFCASLTLVLLLCAARGKARADGRDDLTRLEDAVEEGERDAEDLASFRYARPFALHVTRAPAYLAFDAFVGQRANGTREVSGIVVLQIPLDAWGGASAGIAQALSSQQAPPLDAATSLLPSNAWWEPAYATEPSAVTEEVNTRSAPLRGARTLVVSFDAARACVRAAWRAAGLGDDARIDGMGSRARWSAALPELRLRLARSIDESGRLSLTPDDAARYTEAGGASHGMEARLTFRLDRLLFADEELALERLRVERSELRTRTAGKVLQALFDWQRAYAAATDASLGSEEHTMAAVRELETSAVLDVMTDGWFVRYRMAVTDPSRREP